jgi:nitrogen fixation protein NifQ
MLARTEYFRYDPLMVFAKDSQDHLTCAYASAIDLARSSSRLAGRPGFGLNLGEFSDLLDRFFPGALGVYITPSFKAALAPKPTADADEFDDLSGLLLEFRASEADETRWLAYAMATCCLGDDHLWQDMGLPDRKALSDLLNTHFPALASRNTGGMRWKKFLYKQLCERNRAFVCRSPSCSECSEYSNCFGPEEDGAWR